MLLQPPNLNALLVEFDKSLYFNIDVRSGASAHVLVANFNDVAMSGSDIKIGSTARVLRKSFQWPSSLPELARA